MKLEMTEDERIALERVLGSLNSRAQHRQPMTIESLVTAWARFVEAVERGYELSIYEYANDLAVRDLLDMVISQVPDRLGNVLRAQLEQLDDRYRLATKSSPRPLLPGRDTSDSPRWWRLPRRLNGELKDDLISDGVITE